MGAFECYKQAWWWQGGGRYARDVHVDESHVWTTDPATGRETNRWAFGPSAAGQLVAVTADAASGALSLLCDDTALCGLLGAGFVRRIQLTPKRTEQCTTLLALLQRGVATGRLLPAARVPAAAPSARATAPATVPAADTAAAATAAAPVAALAIRQAAPDTAEPPAPAALPPPPPTPPKDAKAMPPSTMMPPNIWLPPPPAAAPDDAKPEHAPRLAERRSAKPPAMRRPQSSNDLYLEPTVASSDVFRERSGEPSLEPRSAATRPARSKLGSQEEQLARMRERFRAVRENGSASDLTRLASPLARVPSGKEE